MINKTFTFLLVSILFFLFSCESSITQIEPDKEALQKKSNYDNTPEEINLIVWEFSNYAPVDGKNVCIWPRRELFSSVETVNELKNYYGFSRIMSFPYKNEIQIIQNSGLYSKDDIVIKVDHRNEREMIRDFDPMGEYYFDEPVYFDLDANYMNEFVDYILDYSPEATVGMGDFHYRNTTFTKDGDQFSKILERFNYCMFTSYKQWREFLGFWVSWPENSDQRSNWSDMKSLYGSKFSKTWIAAHLDQPEFFTLIEHASNIGINEVWLYQLSEETNSDNILLAFCDAAWKNGYLKKFLTKRIYSYIPKPGEGVKTVEEIKSEGRVKEIVDTGIKQEIIYNSPYQFYPYIEK